MSPRALLDTAREMVRSPASGTQGLWARSAALLGRQALEAGLRRLWTGRSVSLREASFTTQLLCLREYMSDTTLANRVALTWELLSGGCHHRSYGQTPTAPELERWLDCVEELVEHIEKA